VCADLAAAVGAGGEHERGAAGVAPLQARERPEHAAHAAALVA